MTYVKADVEIIRAEALYKFYMLFRVGKNGLRHGSVKVEKIFDGYAYAELFAVRQKTLVKLGIVLEKVCVFGKGAAFYGVNDACFCSENRGNFKRTHKAQKVYV